jgi:hypothetical protein
MLYIYNSSYIEFILVKENDCNRKKYNDYYTINSQNKNDKQKRLLILNFNYINYCSYPTYHYFVGNVDWI